MSTMRTRPGRPTSASRKARWLAVFAVGSVASMLLGFGVWAAAAGSTTPPPDDVEEQIDALNAWFDALPPTTDPETTLQRNLAYEKAFSLIGGETPNDQTYLEPPLGAADEEEHFIAAGISEANEGVPGFQATNVWSGVAEGEHLVVVAVTPDADPKQGGVIVFDSKGQSALVPTPQPVGTVRIQQAEGTVLVLAAEDGTAFTFDMVKRAFV